MNVLSLFDGMSCGQQALTELGVKVDNYFASEIDSYAMSVTKFNYPNTQFIGDVTKVSGHDLPKIDILVGGSPCQGFSFSGKRLNFEDPRSALFFEYVRILKELQEKNPSIKFLLENVVMEKQHEDVITKYLGVKPIKINSNLVSAQQRNRLYWTNLEVGELEDRGIYWDSVQISTRENVMYYSEQAFNWLFKDERRKKRYKEYNSKTKEKMQMLEASHYKGYSNQRCFGIKDDNGDVRYIHPIECERLQNVKDDYTAFGITPEGKQVKISRTQRYKMLGNGWTVFVISHILKQLS